MNAGFQFVCHGGVYVLVSVVRDKIAFDDPVFHAREMNVLGSRNATREDFDTVSQAMSGGLVPTARLATHRAPLEAAPELFPQWIRPETGVLKALIEIS
jgi:threonine dehydrogenase-like Zn-dependent dehydrogenase